MTKYVVLIRDELALDISDNLTIINKVWSKTNDSTLSLGTSQNIWETKMKNLGSDLKEKIGA